MHAGIFVFLSSLYFQSTLPDSYSNASKDSGFWDLIVNEPNIVSSQAIFRSTSGQKTGVLLLDHCSSISQSGTIIAELKSSVERVTLRWVGVLLRGHNLGPS
jgi:hypothetical protein